MDGGEISGNRYGGVSVNSSGTFTMNDGKISGNNSSKGGGVLLQNSGTIFIMNGGEISGNTASYDGGGVYQQQGTFTMNGGVISGNIATDRGGGGVCGKRNLHQNRRNHYRLCQRYGER
jgi:hypothetical protein